MSEATLSIEQFQCLGEVTRLGDGTVVVLEIEDAQLRAFDPSGDLLWTAAHEHMSI